MQKSNREKIKKFFFLRCFFKLLLKNQRLNIFNQISLKIFEYYDLQDNKKGRLEQYIWFNATVFY